eukprot:975090-Pelagomonas_calceolata.AAC.2
MVLLLGRQLISEPVLCMGAQRSHGVSGGAVDFIWTRLRVLFRGSVWERQGPTILMSIATPLVLADQLRHVLQDSGIWLPPSSSMYRDDCDPKAGQGWHLVLRGVVLGLECRSLMCLHVRVRRFEAALHHPVAG